MELNAWLIYSAIALANIVSPGPAILLAIDNGMTKGLGSVYISSLGNIFGLFILSAVAMLGLGVVLQTSTALFTVIKIIGACYLIYLGIIKFRSKASLAIADSNSHLKGYNPYNVFRTGFLVAVTNPKPILFFTALFPLFINSNQSVLPQFALLTTTFMVISYLSLICYGVLSKRIKKWISNERKMIWFNKITGGIFISMGLGMLTIPRSSD